LVRDNHGQKMSKSKGNVLDPIDLIDDIGLEQLVSKRTKSLMQPEMAPTIEKLTRKDFAEGIPAFGTDALRFTFASLASTGRDIKFDMGRIEGYRNFCNKLWNASRFVLMNTEEFDCGKDNKEMELSVADRWIVGRFNQVIQEFETHTNSYRFDLATKALFQFSKNDYCDWYLELSKPLLNSEQSSDQQKRGTRHTLVNVLEATMRLLHPMIPFVTEEIWQRLKPLTEMKDESIMLAPFPIFDASSVDDKVIADLEWIRGIISGIRNIKGELNISPSKPVKVLLKNTFPEDQHRLDNYRGFISSLAKLKSINIVPDNESTPPSSTALSGNVEILVPVAGLIDLDAEMVRLQKEIDKLSSEKTRLSGKLGNSKFVDNAPAAIVEKEKEKLAKSEQDLETLLNKKEQLKKL
ncbi:MAG: class I tRNA ligase family protein, partial [Kangiellaceae bacterium]|nr:class I tRNA ligase family protein [Kangiellaceae bacterium]